MKRAIFASAICAALLLALAGCRAASSSAQTGGASSSVPDSSIASSSGAAASSSRSGSSAAASAAQDEIDDGAFDDMMDALAGYQSGTAGSSLKVYIAACGVLNFSEGYDAGQEQALRGALEQTLSSMDKTGREALADSFPDVDAAAREILKNGVDSVSDILADAGNPNRYDRYDADKYDAVASVLAESLNANG